MQDPVSCLCSCIQSYVTRQDISYVFRTKKKLNNLENAMKDLKAKKKDIEKELHDTQNKRKVPDNQLQRWLQKVGEKDDEVNQLWNEYNDGCCVQGPCCLNCFSRYRISRSAINLLDEITQLKDENVEVSFIEQQPPEPVTESYITVGEKISSNLEVACSYLADEAVGMIGIWGMGGVGKTTLLKKIYQSLDYPDMGFDHLLFIEASQNIQLEKLREEIAKELKLAPPANKKDIENFLKTKNFVLFLDNIWKDIDLGNLGIPHPNGDNTVKRKVIFTTRSEDVCARMGGAGEKIIKVECLEPREAWALFKINVNLAVIESNKEIKEIAWQVMEKCGGLPLVS
ncbi:disease resistance protein UNI-like isoform X2 [Dioscorea cayenensis subsp. rotundata]|uniref:Disease resistance protein UNI-like isoform X2 n=1 Tax=Dioscorea cayennensis subsp. rotundata TaxID=55577 RepID=A0AB40ANX8_DIOCR|nr:disease resistance protein UNI-like isoform X2 [Dioscorea cayenensis subsp. rotundata]